MPSYGFPRILEEKNPHSLPLARPHTQPRNVAFGVLSCIVVVNCRFITVRSFCVLVEGSNQWTQTSAPSNNWLSITSSGTGQVLAAVNNGGGIYISKVLNFGSSLVSMFVSNRLTIWLYIHNGDEKDYGTTWRQSSAPSAGWYSIASDVSCKYLVANAYSGGIWTSQVLFCNIKLSCGSRIERTHPC